MFIILTIGCCFKILLSDFIICDEENDPTETYNQYKSSFYFAKGIKITGAPAQRQQVFPEVFLCELNILPVPAWVSFYIKETFMRG